MTRWSLILPCLGLSLSLSALATGSPQDAGAAGNGPPSLTASFQEFWTGAQGKPFGEQEALWDRYIEGPRQELYDWVVWEKRDAPEWRKEKDYTLKARFAAYPGISDHLSA